MRSGARRLLHLLVALLALGAERELDARPPARKRVAVPNFVVSGATAFPDATFSGATYAWPQPQTSLTPNMIASSGGTNANIPLSATNTTFTQGVSTAPTGDNAPFGNAAGLRAQGIGTARINDAWSSAAQACWLNLTPVGFSAITEGTNFAIRTIFRPTTTASTKVMYYFNSSASEYIQLEMGTAITVRLREGASGNVTITWTPALNVEHLLDAVYVSDCNGDAGNPCLYLYVDGELARNTGGAGGAGTGWSPPGMELNTNMADFGAAASVQVGCTSTETNRWNGEILGIAMFVGADMTARFGSNSTQYLAAHRTDCQADGICDTATTVRKDLVGQSLSQGFNGTATSAVTVTSNVAQATVATNHGIRVGDRITTTNHTTNTSAVLVTAVDATHVSYPLVASDGALADGVGTITLNAHTLTQNHNFRECRNNGTIPLLVEGTAGAGAAYESSLSASANFLAEYFGRPEHFVGMERGYSDTSITENNWDTTDGSASTSNADTIITWISECDDRIGGLGSATVRDIVDYDQGEGSGDAPGADFRRTEWSEYFVSNQEELDTRIKAVSGQSEEVAVCFQQTNSHTASSMTNATIMQEQLTAHELLHNDGRGYLAGPKYWMPYSDGTHLTGVGYSDMQACTFARCENAVLSGSAWEPTRPTALALSSNDVTVTVNAPVPPLVIDTTNVSDPGSRGFEYFDSDPASNPTISSVSLGSCTGSSCPVTITMSSSPDHAGARIRYAYTGSSGNSAGPTTGARGNVRDSQGDGTGSSCANVSNWLASFDKPITRTFVDDFAWDFDGTAEECDATDSTGLESANGLGQTATGFVLDVWVRPDAGGFSDRNVIAKGNNTTHKWSLLTEAGGGAVVYRFAINGVANFVQFGDEACGSPFDNCSITAHSGSGGLTAGRVHHVVVSVDSTRGTLATDQVIVASNVATARVPAGVPSYIVNGQTVVSTGHTVNTAASGVALTVVDATHISYALVTADVNPMADGTGTLTINDAKVKAYTAECDGSTPPNCPTLTEVLMISNGTMPADLGSDNAQALRVGGFGTGAFYIDGRIYEAAFWYTDAIDTVGTTITHRSYNATEVRTCLETVTTHKPVDHAQLSGLVYNDGGIYKSCDWPQLRAWYRMGDLSSGTTLENHTWLTLPSGVAGSLTCSGNTGTDIVSDSID